MVNSPKSFRLARDHASSHIVSFYIHYLEAMRHVMKTIVVEPEKLFSRAKVALRFAMPVSIIRQYLLKLRAR